MDAGEIHRLKEDRKKTEWASKTRRNILRWLSLDDFEDTHERHFEKRFKDTGRWLLEDPRFINWRDGTQSSQLLCYGARKLQSYTSIYIYLY